MVVVIWSVVFANRRDTDGREVKVDSNTNFDMTGRGVSLDDFLDVVEQMNDLKEQATQWYMTSELVPKTTVFEDGSEGPPVYGIQRGPYKIAILHPDNLPQDVLNSI